MNTTECPLDAALQMFVEGTLLHRERHVVKHHIALCRDCRTKVAHYKQIMWDVQLLDAVNDGPEAGPELDGAHDRLAENLMQAWHAKSLPEPVSPPSGRRLLPAWAGHSVSWTRNLPGLRRLSVGRRPRAAARPLWRLVAGRLIRRR